MLRPVSEAVVVVGNCGERVMNVVVMPEGRPTLTYRQSL
jgi:hypothetical protein